MGDQIDPLACRPLENMKALSFAVSGSRKVAAVVSYFHGFLIKSHRLNYFSAVFQLSPQIKANRLIIHY